MVIKYIISSENNSWNNLKEIEEVNANLCDYHLKMIRVDSVNDIKIVDSDIDWIRKLYALRSKVVHGSNLKDNEVESALIGSFLILSELKKYMIENEKMIIESDFEEAIFK